MTDNPKLDDLLPETLCHVGSFLPGKSLSTLALVFSTSRREPTRAVVYLMSIGAHQRCTSFLADAPSELQEYWSLMSSDALGTVDDYPPSMRKRSEWCAAMDYCEQSPHIMSEFYQKDYNNHATSQKKCWPLGFANFRGSQVVLSSHNWKPQLLDLCEQWFDPNVHFHPIVYLGEDDDDFDSPPFQTAGFGVLSWRDDAFLLQTLTDGQVALGTVVTHASTYPQHLRWLPVETRRAYPIIGRKLSENGLEWLANIVTSNNHMLSAWDTHGFSNASTSELVRDEYFIDKVVKLLRMMDDGLW